MIDWLEHSELFIKHNPVIFVHYYFQSYKYPGGRKHSIYVQSFLVILRQLERKPKMKPKMKVTEPFGNSKLLKEKAAEISHTLTAILKQHMAEYFLMKFVHWTL